MITPSWSHGPKKITLGQTRKIQIHSGQKKITKNRINLKRVDQAKRKKSNVKATKGHKEWCLKKIYRNKIQIRGGGTRSIF
jgi:hypothetical protein